MKWSTMQGFSHLLYKVAFPYTNEFWSLVPCNNCMEDNLNIPRSLHLPSFLNRIITDCQLQKLKPDHKTKFLTKKWRDNHGLYKALVLFLYYSKKISPLLINVPTRRGRRGYFFHSMRLIEKEPTWKDEKKKPTRNFFLHKNNKTNL